MAQRQFRTDDTSLWPDRFGSGSDGAYTASTGTDTTPCTSISVTSGSTSATFGSGSGFVDGALLLIHQSRNGGGGVGNWELNKIASGGGTTSVTLSYPTIQAYDTTAQVYFLKQYASVDIPNGVTLSAQTWDGSKGGIIAFLSLSTITVTGTISANASGYRGGLQQTGSGANYFTYCGEGTGGASTQTTSQNGNGGGGGRKRASGGTGGHSATGLTGILGNDSSGNPGSGGATSGQANLVVMTFGGAGGASGTTGGGDPNNGTGRGGQGGGIVILIGKQITVTGSVTTTGEQGANGTGSDYGGGANGAGGSVLIKGQQVVVGSNLVTALGNNNMASGDAAHPQVPSPAGRVHIDYSQILSGSTDPTLDSSLDTILNDLPSIENYTLLM